MAYGVWCSVGVLAVAAAQLAGCGSSDASPATGMDAATEAAPAMVFTSCHDPAPAGFTPPEAAHVRGHLPDLSLTPGDAGAAGVPPENDITSSGRHAPVQARHALGPRPRREGAGRLPLVLAGGRRAGLRSTADVIDAAQQQRFIAVVPEAKKKGASAYTSSGRSASSTRRPASRRSSLSSTTCSRASASSSRRT